MIVNCQKVKARIVEMNLTQTKIAEQMGIDRCTLNAKINDPNGTRLTLKDISRLCEILSIDDPTVYFFVTCGAKMQHDSTLHANN